MHLSLLELTSSARFNSYHTAISLTLKPHMIFLYYDFVNFALDFNGSRVGAS